MCICVCIAEWMCLCVFGHLSDSVCVALNLSVSNAMFDLCVRNSVLYVVIFSYFREIMESYKV